MSPDHDDQLNEQKRRYYEFEGVMRKQKAEMAKRRAADEVRRKREQVTISV